MAYKYDIHDISGEENVWADLLSRWGSSFKTVCAIRQVDLPLSPQLDDSFIWPTQLDIAAAQDAAPSPNDLVRSSSDALWTDGKARVRIPDDAVELQVIYICVVGHIGVAGHRGVATTLENIANEFFWKNIEKDIEFSCGDASTARVHSADLHSYVC
ncbi:hypothetical protein PC116_g1514 [Phytophthora cactorum]|nr:hypothetical protein Pcac1_g19465 [Phytophthora cactorum]KAG2935879.1 hypothetical protein PC114_g443 [Phytophthora cactorum]KAG3192788.1 hypothetical protein PC128_g10403 [Phytophthora cactorum]KAG4064864.1 hypothetical protein PC123_g398 [Phytophthora cactorum]KAG4250792.1 hypothetical protein PC116_g1514 [Phytophthora cactorum]